MRRILVLGAAGGIGRHVIEQAAATDLEVTALVRTPDKLPAKAGRLRVVTGDIRTGSSNIRDAFERQDAVISALGVGQSFKSGGLIGQAAPLIVSAMHEHGVRRLVFTSAFGVGTTWRDTPLVPRLFVKTLLRDVYADKAAGEGIIKNSGLDWTIVYPAGLTNGRRSGSARLGERLTYLVSPASRAPTLRPCCCNNWTITVCWQGRSCRELAGSPNKAFSEE